MEKERLDLLKALQESHTWIEFFALFSWLQYNDLFDVPVLKVMAHNVERKITKRFLYYSYNYYNLLYGIYLVKLILQYLNANFNNIENIAYNTSLEKKYLNQNIFPIYV